MTSTTNAPATTAARDLTEGLSLRQAALIAACSLLVMSILSPVAFFGIFPGIIVRSDVARTIQNITTHRGLYLAGVFCYLLTFLADVLVAWALYIFLRPANAALSLLAAWFRVAYAVLGLSLLLKLVTVYRLVVAGDFVQTFGSPQFTAQVQVLLLEFRYGWGFSMLVFAVHLLLLSYVLYRSGYVPRILGVLIAINGAGYIVDSLQPFTFPVPYLFLAFFGELIFMVWLFVKGRKVERRSL